MDNHKDRPSDEEILDLIWDSFYEAESQSEDTVREALKEDGIDPNKVLKKGLDLVNSLLGKQRLLEAKLRHENLLARIKKAFDNRKRQAGENAKDVIVGLLGFQEASAYFRDLKSTDDKSFLDILNDIQMLDLLEKLEEKEETEEED